MERKEAERVEKRQVNIRKEKGKGGNGRNKGII